MIEELGVRLRADGVVQATNGVNLTGKAVEDLGRKADAAAPALARVGKTSKETAAAMRLLPAQITDITTSLASGQPAWLVAIQQGGQIKDSFGGIGPAATAMRAAISPLALALGGTAVAMGAVIAAYEMGQREAQAYTKAIVMSGNAAGVTSGQLGDMAAAIDEVVGTQSDAADALTQLVASGQVGSRGLQQFAETAVRMERVTGQSIEDTVKTFADLGRAPLQASVRLNESFNYLTSATYNHIKALVEQKKMSEAAAVAQQAYADAIRPRLTQLEGNLGSLQRAWIGVKSIAAEAWDAMLGIGREDSVAEKIKSAQVKIANIDSALGSAGNFGKTEQRQRRAQLVEEIASLREMQRMQERAAATRSAEASAVKDEIAATADKKSGVDAAAAAYANLHDQIARRQSQAQAEIDSEGKLTEAERFRVDMLREIAEAQAKIGVAGANRLRAEVETTSRTIANLELQRQAANEQQEIHKRFVAERQQATEAATREADQIRQGNEALASETDELGLNAQALYARSQALLQNTIADKQARLERISGLPAYAEEAAALEQQIELLRQRAGLAAGKYAKELAIEEGKANQERTDAIASSIEEGVINGFRDGRSASAAFLREIQAQFLRAALKLPIQVMAQTGSDLMGGLLKLLPIVFGGGGGIMGNDIGLGYHGGGVGAGEASFRRSLPAGAFAGAPRFHGGIGPGELPAVIKSDEGVFTKEQMRAMAPVSDMARASGPNVTFAPVVNIDSRTDKAEIAGLVGRAMRVAQADLLDKMQRKQV